LPPFWDCVTASSSRVSGPIKNAGTGGYMKCTGCDRWPVDRKSTTPIRLKSRQTVVALQRVIFRSNKLCWGKVREQEPSGWWPL
jgi:hypothetical protein